MLEFTQTPPQSATPYSPAGDQTAEMPENTPKLGTPVPGTTGGLPALSGLSVAQNPMADEFIATAAQPQVQPQQQTNDVNPNAQPQQAPQRLYPPAPQFAGGGAVQKAEQVRQMGRGEDSVLMHVTPHELKGLQALAMAHGGSLTINPHTGLPEAGFLGSLFKKLLPTVLGAGMMFIPGVNALTAAGIVGLGSTAMTGSLKKGLMAGLGAYGGASLARGLGAGVQAASSAVPSVGANLPSYSSLVTGVPGSAAATAGTTAAKTGLAGIAQNFGKAASAGLPKGIISKAAPMLAATGLMQGVSGAMAPTGPKMPTGQIDNSYQGPYTAEQRTATFAPTTEDLLSSSKERRYFNTYVPEVRNTYGQLVQPGASTAPGTPILQRVLNPKAKKNEPMYMDQYVPYMGGIDMGYAEGGEVELSDGAFVLDARTVSELGNGSSNAGKEALRRIGGRPIDGPGDGVSDSIPARIGRDQPARVARDEVVIPADVVKRIGKGNPKRGADKLYALMDKAHKARKKAKRGQDTKLRKGLA